MIARSMMKQPQKRFVITIMVPLSEVAVSSPRWKHVILVIGGVHNIEDTSFVMKRLVQHPNHSQHGRCLIL
jgi:hypothetical protein